MYPLISIALFIIFYPYCRILFKRVIAWHKIKKFCTKNHYSLQKNHILGFLGINRSSKCDCYIETDKYVYSIKFFSVKNKRNTLIFTSDKKYFFRKTHVYFGWTFLCLSTDSKKRKFVDYDFRYRCSNTSYLKLFKPILLINPICIEIKKRNGDTEKTLGAGEIIYNTYIYSVTRLLEQISYDHEK